MTGKGRRQMPHSVRNKRKTEWILAGLGFALFLPYFLAFWPGVSTPDSIWQLRQAMHLTNYQSQHPFLHTLMIEMCYRIGSSAAGALHDFTGGRLFTHLSDQTALYEAASASQTGIAADRIAGNPAFVNYGVALYSLVSMALLTAADMAVLRLLRRNGAPRWALGMLWLFFFAFPFNAVLSITMWKDVPFSAVVMLTMGTLWDHERNHRVWRRRGHAGFVLLGFLFCTLRSNGIAAWLFFTVVYLLVHRHALRRGRETGRILADLGLSLLCAALFLGPVQRAAHVEKADPTEMLSIPLQQVAYTIVRNGVDGGGRISEEELETLREVVDVEQVPSYYDSGLSDAIKALVRERQGGEKIMQNPGRWAALYLRIGLRNPDCYAEAYYRQTYGYYVPTAGTKTGYASEVQDNPVGLYRVYLLPYSAVIGVYNLLNLCSRGYFAVWCNAFTLYVFLGAMLVIGIGGKRKGRRERKRSGGAASHSGYSPHPGLVFLLPVGILLTVLLSTPAANDFRYVYPLFLSMPAAVIMALRTNK